MNRQPIFQGAYWRRFSNAAATGFVTENNNYQTASQVCTLRLESNDLAMGTVTCRLLSEPQPTDQGREPGTPLPGTYQPADMYSVVATPTFKKGSRVRIIASSSANYVWDRFEDGAGNVIPSNTAQIDITLNQSMTVRAFFRARNVQQQSTLTVSYNHAQGTVTASPALVNDKVTVNVGAEVVLTATPKQGYVFKQWRNALVAGKPNSSPTLPTHTERMVTGSKTIFADFAPAPSTPGNPDNPGGDEPKKTLTVSWDAKKGRVTCSSSISKTKDGFTVTATSGDTVTLKAAPLTGYRFVKWTGGPVNGRTDDQVTLAVSADYAVYAEFAADNGGGGGGGGDDPGGGGGGGSYDPTDPTVTNGGDTTGKVMAFVKKWWWALLIGAYLVYDATKGGRK